MPLAKEKLLLAQLELDQLERALANSGFTDPFPTAAAEAEAVVTTYTAAYTLSTAHAERLQRPIIIYDLYSRLGSVPEAVQKAYDAAMAELKDIRDGKFPGLTDATGGSTGSTGGWGSRTKLNFPGDVTE